MGPGSMLMKAGMCMYVLRHDWNKYEMNENGAQTRASSGETAQEYRQEEASVSRSGITSDDRIAANVQD